MLSSWTKGWSPEERQNTQINETVHTIDRQKHKQNHFDYIICTIWLYTDIYILYYRSYIVIKQFPKALNSALVMTWTPEIPRGPCSFKSEDSTFFKFCDISQHQRSAKGCISPCMWDLHCLQQNFFFLEWGVSGELMRQQPDCHGLC